MNSSSNSNDNYLSVMRRPSVDRANVMSTNFEDRSSRKPSSSSSSLSIGMLQIQEKCDGPSPSRASSTSASVSCCMEGSGRWRRGTDSCTSLMTAMDEEEDCVEELGNGVEQVSVFEEDPGEDTIDTIFIDDDIAVIGNCRNTRMSSSVIGNKSRQLKGLKRIDNKRDTGVKENTDISPTSKSSKTKDSNGLNSPDARPASDTQISMGWSPVMPGYKNVHPNGGGAVVIQRTLEVNSYDGSLRDSIPAMPKVLAVICFVFNIITPGLGTLLAGFSVLCCSKIRGGGDKVSVIWINTCVTLLQIITTPLFLLGWIWSILWGMSFLTFSDSNECPCLGVGCKESNPEQVPNHGITENEGHICPEGQGRPPNSTISNVTLSVQDNDILDIGDEQNDSNMHNEAPPQAIIVLQETPVVQNQATSNYERRGSVQVRRNSRQHGRQNRAESLPHILLDPQTLENIITRNGAIPAIFRSESDRGYDEQLKSPFSVT